MRCCLLLLFCFILCSCGRSYTNNEAIDAVNASVDALEQSLSKECKTQAINSQFTAIRKENVREATKRGMSYGQFKGLPWHKK